MSDQTLGTIAVISCLFVGAILVWGLGTFGRGGEASSEKSNKIMRYRLIAQAGVVILILALVAFRSSGGN